MRQLFPSVREAVETVMPVERLRWIAFSHLEADECGSVDEFLEVAPHAQVAHGSLGVMLSLQDQLPRAPRALADGEVIDLGGKRVRHLDTPHVPHGWEARVLYEETTGTLLCGDLFTQTGSKVTTDDDIIEPAMFAEDFFKASSLAPTSGATVRRLADLAPRTLALMHGPSFSGDCAGALKALADDYDARVAAATQP
jgi:flavorubredoxin